MAEPIIVSTEGITGVTGGLDDLSDRLTNISTNLRNRVGDLSGVWGDDKAGRQFRAEYEAPSVQLMTALPELARVLDSVAEGLRVMSRNYEAAEEQAGVHARNLTVAGERTPTTDPHLFEPGTAAVPGQVVGAPLAPSPRFATRQAAVRGASAEPAAAPLEPTRSATQPGLPAEQFDDEAVRGDAVPAEPRTATEPVLLSTPRTAAIRGVPPGQVSTEQ